MMFMTKEQLYEKYKFLVYRVIKNLNCQFRNQEEYQEYCQIGQLGLIKAIHNFDNTKNITTRYFYICIKNEIIRHFIERNSWKKYLNYTNMISIEDYQNFKDTIDDPKINIEKDYIKKEQYETLYKAIDMLKPSYKEIIVKYFGINYLPKTLEEIAKEKNISRQAINVKKNSALINLKSNLKKLGVEKFE